MLSNVKDSLTGLNKNDYVNFKFNDWLIKKDSHIYICSNDIFRESNTQVKE